MKLNTLNWQGSQDNNTQAFIEYMLKMYPEQVQLGEIVKTQTTHKPEKALDSWTNEVNTLLPKEGISVTTINIDGETINALYKKMMLKNVTESIKPTYQKTLTNYLTGIDKSYIAGINQGRLIVINEGVLVHDNPTEALLNSRKTKIGMHELLENILINHGQENAHNKITHINLKTRNECVNDQDISIFLQPITKAQATTRMYDNAGENYCTKCQELLLKYPS